MRVKIRRTNGPDLSIDIADASAYTVAQLRQHIAESLNITDLSYIRLIHNGRVMVDGEFNVLSDYSVQDGGVMHAVIRNHSQNEASSTSSTTSPFISSHPPGSIPPSTSGTNNSIPPNPTQQMRYQDLGNGVVVGSISLSSDEASQFLNSMNLSSLGLPLPTSSSTTTLPLPNPNSIRFPMAGHNRMRVSNPLRAMPMTNTFTNRILSSAQSSTTSSRRRILAHHRQFPAHIEGSYVALQTLIQILDNPAATQAMETLQDGYSTTRGLSVILLNLGICMSGIQLPVNTTAIQLSNGSFLASTNTVQDRIHRTQELQTLSSMLRSLAVASRNIADALDSVMILESSDEDRNINPSHSNTNVQSNASPTTNNTTNPSNSTISTTPPVPLDPVSRSNNENHPVDTTGNSVEPENNNQDQDRNQDRNQDENESDSTNNTDDPTMMVDREISDDININNVSSSSNNNSNLPMETELEEEDISIDHIMETLQNQFTPNLNANVGQGSGNRNDNSLSISNDNNNDNDNNNNTNTNIRETSRIISGSLGDIQGFPFNIQTMMESITSAMRDPNRVPTRVIIHSSVGPNISPTSNIVNSTNNSTNNNNSDNTSDQDSSNFQHTTSHEDGKT